MPESGGGSNNPPPLRRPLDACRTRRPEPDVTVREPGRQLPDPTNCRLLFQLGGGIPGRDNSIPIHVLGVVVVAVPFGRAETTGHAQNLTQNWTADDVGNLLLLGSTGADNPRPAVLRPKLIPLRVSRIVGWDRA